MALVEEEVSITTPWKRMKRTCCTTEARRDGTQEDEKKGERPRRSRSKSEDHALREKSVIKRGVERKEGRGRGRESEGRGQRWVNLYQRNDLHWAY